jgi:flagellar basal body rod protein FlgB
LPLYKRQRQLHEKEMKEKEEKQQKEKEIKFDSSHTAILAGSAEEAAVRARAFDTNKHAAAQLAEQKNTVAAVNKVESAIKAMKFEVV